MKILYIACHSHIGWGAEYWVNQAFLNQGCETVLYDYKSARKSIKPWWLIRLEIKALAKREKPDIIFVQRARYMPSYVLRGLNAQMVLWSTEPIQLKSCVDKLLRSDLFSWVFLHSYSCRERVQKEFSHYYANSTVIHNAAPATIIDESCTKKQFAIFNRTLSPRREEWLAPSHKMITHEHGKYGDEYFNALAISEVAPNVHFSDENIDDFESGIFEAMAKGCVVVSETLNPQTVKDLGMENSYIEVSSPNNMVEKLQELQNSPELIQMYKKRSYQVIKSNTWNERALQFITKFKDIINKSNC